MAVVWCKYISVGYRYYGWTLLTLHAAGLAELMSFGGVGVGMPIAGTVCGLARIHLQTSTRKPWDVLILYTAPEYTLEWLKTKKKTRFVIKSRKSFCKLPLHAPR